MQRSIPALLPLSIVALALLAIPAPTSAQGTPDGMPPAFEETCNTEEGAAFGLCNAYCEAMDCHCFNEESCQPAASSTACGRVRQNFTRQTGREVPCDVAVGCPCLNDDNWPSGRNQWYGFATGELRATTCTFNGVVSVASSGTGAGVDTVNNECFIDLDAVPFDFLEVTDSEADFCAALLLNLEACN